jgi:hypothetical protein
MTNTQDKTIVPKNIRVTTLPTETAIISMNEMEDPGFAWHADLKVRGQLRDDAESALRALEMVVDSWTPHSTYQRKKPFIAGVTLHQVETKRLLLPTKVQYYYEGDLVKYIYEGDK